MSIRSEIDIGSRICMARAIGRQKKCVRIVARTRSTSSKMQWKGQAKIECTCRSATRTALRDAACSIRRLPVQKNAATEMAGNPATENKKPASMALAGVSRTSGGGARCAGQPQCKRTAPNRIATLHSLTVDTEGHTLRHIVLAACCMRYAVKKRTVARRLAHSSCGQDCGQVLFTRVMSMIHKEIS
jgi:hypothetical protein